MTTATWITIILALSSVILSLMQTVFWFQIRDLHRRVETTNSRVDAVEKALGECQYRHTSSAATKGDVAEVKGAVTSLHRRIDELYRLLLEKKGGDNA
ncbi:MAG: hypothetical protein AB1824_01275 [Acidobacteriota bacterium]